MVRLVDPKQPGKGILWGEINTLYLWGPPDENILSPTTEFCVLDQLHHTLICTLPGPASLPDPVTQQMIHSASGQFEWEYNEKEYLASYWSLFLKDRFLTPKWIVLLAESKSDILSPIADFKRNFSLVILLSLWVVLFLSIRQIRKSLVPLEKLRETTRRIAMRDFDSRVVITSGDEFEELAASFNAMSDQLGRQFNALAAMTEIDRAILSALDTKAIITIVLTRMRDVSPCDGISITLLDTTIEDTGRTYVRDCKAENDSQILDIRLTPEEMQQLTDHPESLRIDGAENVSNFLAPLALHGNNTFLCFPFFLKQRLGGMITLGYAHPPVCYPEDLVRARQLTDQVGVALSNARMIDQIRFLASYDRLTELPNRRLLKEQLVQALSYARRHQRLVALLFFDLDFFQRINDTFGYDAGDHLLQAVSVRLTDCVRLTDSVVQPSLEELPTILSRLGGNEFAIILTDLTEPQYVAKVTQRIFDALSPPFILQDHEVFMTASIGIALYPMDGEDVETLLKNGHAAMQHAKERGKNNFQYYTQSMNVAALERLTLENDLRKALKYGEFVVYYQPKLDMATGEIIGMEALIRWKHPDKGMISPVKFIPLAEETGLIVPIGEWVLRTACAQNKSWQAAGLKPLHVAVNLSARQFRVEHLNQSVAQILSDTGLDPRYLELELTESMLMENIETTIIKLQQLKDLGLHISIDDFGTGYSSLNYLKRFPIDGLKIDQSFVRDITTNSDDATIVTAIIAMAHNLKLKVIAEGVETEQQLSFLRDHGCDEMQGYLFSKPVPADLFIQLVQEGRSLNTHTTGQKMI
jgi:diguanylate cyclase (GGDEF)-like protein